MATIITRAGKGSPLTHQEVDDNFTNLNTDKLEPGAAFDAAVAATPAVTANTAKVTNATHTGDVTGATSLTIDKTAITGKSAVTADPTDYVLISDTSDSGNLKKALIPASDWAYITLSTNNVNTNFAVPSEVFRLALDANSLYEIEGKWILSCSGTAIGARVSWDSPTAGLLSSGISLQMPSSVTATVLRNLGTLGGIVVAATTTSPAGTFLGQGQGMYVTDTSVTGDVVLYVYPHATGTCTMHEGSFIRYRKTAAP